MRKIIFILLPIILFSQIDESYQIAAENIIFKKNNLHFENGFFLEHSFGKIYANKARFSNFRKGKLFDFRLQNGVKLITNTNGTLISDNADFDSIHSKVRFYSKDKVNYVDKIKKKDLKITSKEVECFLNTKKCIKNLNLENIYSISFFDDVILSIEDKFNIYSEKALFEKKDSSSNIYLYPKEYDFCIFTYEGSEITSKSATLDLNNLDLHLISPNGTIKNLIKRDNIICFSADNLLWQNFENALILKDNVKVIDTEFGVISSDEVELIKKAKENTIRKIISRKNTTINFFTRASSQLTTKGIIELDHEKKQIMAFSLKKQNQDLVYEDSNVYISAKRAKLNYGQDEKIQSILLEKDVKFIYQKDKSSIGYGIADKIQYIPEEDQIKLISDNDNKVLFWRDDKSLSLSAKEIHINQKEKNDIKGIGDVRFTFNIEEENLIHDIFSKYMSYE